RADAHQGEYVAARDERLTWLTGFTGSAGFAAVLAEQAGLFVDGRYTLQAAAQVDTEVITPLPWPKTELGGWLAEALPQGGKVGFDPWLHSAQQIDKLRESGAAAGLTYVPVENLVDAVWDDQPAPPMVPVWVHPAEIAGEDHGAKRARLAEGLRTDGISAAVLTLPDSVAWLLNLRGGDIARTPVPHGFAILHEDGRVQLFLAAEKVSPEVRAHLGNDVTVAPPGDLIPALERLEGPVRIEAGSLPVALRDVLAEPVAGAEPVKGAKARKNDRELAGMVAAHRRDAVAVARFLHWLDGAAPSGGLTEIDVVRQLEAMRAEAPELRDIAFETIAGSGPNGAIVHYRVTEET
ncbi:MAG: aminopeptidase P family N-terminal domain-containing protein, partial [Pseudomonadota bacterium]